MVEKEEWKEVFIFAGGIFKNQQEQDEFLDFVMEYNLPLYVECVDAKSDVSGSDSTNVPSRLLTQILKTYRFILDKYFCPIKMLFEPFYVPDHFATEKEQKVAIRGSLSDDQKWLSYWFDLVSADESDVQCINEKQLEEYHRAFEEKAFSQRRSIVSHGTNLRLSGFGDDSGRKIAINLIKAELKDLIEKKKLIEDKYLLCERVSSYKQRIKKIKNVDDLPKMQGIIDKMVDEVLEKNPYVEGFNYDGVEIFPFQKILHDLNWENAIWSECVLPGPDLPRPEKGSWFTWDLYSKKQKEWRIARFFYCHENSYLNMVDYNFPVLKKYFRRYNDAPYQVVVEVDHKEKANPRDFTSEPTIQYYYIASSTNEIPHPMIQEVEEKAFSDHRQIMQDIQESYAKQGRTAKRLSTTMTGFTFVITSRRTCENNPLSDYVYESIKESLEDIFGSIQ